MLGQSQLQVVFQQLEGDLDFPQPQVGRAPHSVRADWCQSDDGAHGVTRPTSESKNIILLQI